MPARPAGAVPPLLPLLLLVTLPGQGPAGENTELPPFSTAGAHHSLPEDAASPALGATVIIIITTIISGGAYLCFLKYICSGCCKATQVVPERRPDATRSEEQV